MLWEQRDAGRSEMVREKRDPSFVAVFHCQEHQLRGICLWSLVIVDSMLEAIVL